MGSHLGPVLVNLIMGFPEKKWLDQFQVCDILLYHRYVHHFICLFSNFICLFNSEQDGDEFFEFFKFQHPNIKFTFKKKTRKMTN